MSRWPLMGATSRSKYSKAFPHTYLPPADTSVLTRIFLGETAVEEILSASIWLTSVNL